MSKEHIISFLTIQSNIKLYHWMTKSYPRHKASDELYEKMDKLLDRFVETYIGRYQRPSMTTVSITMQCMSDAEMNKYLKSTVKMFDNMKITESDLVNLKDETISTLNQALYLFTLS